MFYKNNMYNYEFRDLNAFDEFILGWGGTAKLFHSICIILCSCQRWSRVPIFPHLHQRLLVLGFILVFVKWCFFLSLSLSLFFCLASRRGDLCSLIRDQTCGPLHWKYKVLTTGPPGQFLLVVLVCFSLMTDSVEHLFLCLLAPAHFVLNGCTFFYCMVLSLLIQPIPLWWTLFVLSCLIWCYRWYCHKHRVYFLSTHT